MMRRTSFQCERMAAVPSPNDEHLIWIDLEMTGLDTDRDSILEIATVVTDKQLNVLAEGPELAIAHPLARLEAMDEWNRNQHGRSGLWQRVLDSKVSLADADRRIRRFGRRVRVDGRFPPGRFAQGILAWRVLVSRRACGCDAFVHVLRRCGCARQQRAQQYG